MTNPNTQTYKVTVVDFYCQASDDEGADNDVDMDRFGFWAYGYNKKNQGDPGTLINPQDKGYYWGTDGEKTMAVGDRHIVNKSTSLTFDSTYFEHATLKLKAYARDYDSGSANEEATAEITLQSKDFLKDYGRHYITLKSEDFTFEVLVIITLEGPDTDKKPAVPVLTQQTYKVKVVDFICDVSDDEGANNDVDMDRFGFWAYGYNKKNQDDLGTLINPGDAGYYWGTSGEKTMAVGARHIVNKSTILTFDSTNFEHAVLKLKAYARDYDSGSANEEATTEITLHSKDFLANKGRREIELKSKDFTFRVRIVISKVKQTEPFTLIIASDPQLHGIHFRDADTDPPKDDAARSRDFNRWMVRAMNNITSLGRWPSSHVALGGGKIAEPEGVVINGDQTEDGREEQRDMFDLMYQQQLELPIWPSLGNHDYENNIPIRDYNPGKRRESDQAGWDGDWGNFENVDYGRVWHMWSYHMNTLSGDASEFDRKNNFGGYESYDPGSSMAYSFEIGDYHFIHLNNFPTYNVTLYHKHTGLTSERKHEISSSLAWLESDLAIASMNRKKIVLFTHKLENWVSDDIKDNQGKGFQEFCDVIRNYDVVAIFAGHLHHLHGYWGYVDVSKAQLIGDNGTRDVLPGNPRRTSQPHQIPVFRSGSADFHTFLLVEFGDTYMNVGVIDTTDGHPTFLVDKTEKYRGDKCFYYRDESNHKWSSSQLKEGTRVPIPEFPSDPVFVLTPDDGTAGAIVKAFTDAAHITGKRYFSQDAVVDASLNSFEKGRAHGKYLAGKAISRVGADPLFLYAGPRADSNTLSFFQGAWSELQPKLHTIRGGGLNIVNSDEAMRNNDKPSLSSDALGKIIDQISTNGDSDYARELAEANMVDGGDDSLLLSTYHTLSSEIELNPQPIVFGGQPNQWQMGAIVPRVPRGPIQYFKSLKSAGLPFTFPPYEYPVVNNGKVSMKKIELPGEFRFIWQGQEVGLGVKSAPVLPVGTHKIAVIHHNSTPQYADLSTWVEIEVVKAKPTITLNHTLSLNTEVQIADLQAKARWTVNGESVEVPGTFTYALKPDPAKPDQLIEIAKQDGDNPTIVTNQNQAQIKIDKREMLIVTFTPADEVKANYETSEVTLPTLSPPVDYVLHAVGGILPYDENPKTGFGVAIGNGGEQLPVTYLYQGTGETSYGPTVEAPIAPGTYRVTATIGGNHRHSATADLIITPAVPTINLSVPEGVVQGAKLDDLQLNPTASAFVGNRQVEIEGKFTYYWFDEPVSSTHELTAGYHRLRVDFEPKESNKFTKATATEELRVWLATHVFGKYEPGNEETFSHLALKYYGHATPYYWQWILDHNKGIIPENYKLTRPGTKVYIPEPPPSPGDPE